MADAVHHQRCGNPRREGSGHEHSDRLTPLFGRGRGHQRLAGQPRASRSASRLTSGAVPAHDPFDAVPIVGKGVSPAIIEQLIERRRQMIAGRPPSDVRQACSAAGITLADAPAGPRAASAGWIEETGRGTSSCRAGHGRAISWSSAGADGGIAGFTVALEATLFGAGGRCSWCRRPTRDHRRTGRDRLERQRCSRPRRSPARYPSWTGQKRSRAERAARRTDPRGPRTWWAICAGGASSARIEPVAAADEPVGEALLEAAGEAGADVVVIGGYGRTRLASSCSAGRPTTCSNHRGCRS